MADEQEQRYEDILKRIANRKPFGQHQDEDKPASPYDLIIDSLNSYDILDKLAQRPYSNLIVHGPKALRYKTWSGVVIWYRPKGYHGYKTLSLFGVWASQVGSDIQLTIGIRELPYRAAVYSAEGYFATIQKDFKLFYEDRGNPPTDDDIILFQTTHQAKERLIYRQTLSKIANQWAVDVNRN